jgi:ketosteroid isomerase-like protein
MAFIGSPEDKQLIRERLDTYSDAVTRQDLETYLGCWTDDGRRTGAGGECAGKDELLAHWHGIFGAIEQMAFFTQLASIIVDGDRAFVRSYCIEVIAPKAGDTRQLVGEYEDELVRADDGWLFSQRSYRVVLRY